MKKFKVIVAKYSHENGHEEVHGKEAQVPSGITPRFPFDPLFKDELGYEGQVPSVEGDEYINIHMLEEAFNSGEFDVILEKYKYAPVVWELTRDVEMRHHTGRREIDGEWVQAYRGQTMRANDILVIAQ